MSLYDTSEPYSLARWYEHTGAYDLNAGTDSMLDLTRHILESDAYLWQGIAFPTGNDVYIPGQTTFSGTVVMPSNAYIVALTGYSPIPFAVRIYDKGAQTDLFYRQFAYDTTVVSQMQTGLYDSTGLVFAQNMPFGPYFFRDPLIVLPPGILQVQVTSTLTIAPPTVPIQVLFSIAVPKTTTSLNNRKVLTPKDPTGTQTIQGLIELL